MRQPPRPTRERLLSWPLLARAYLWLGLLEAGVAMAAFFFVLHLGGWQYGGELGKLAPLYLQATTACLAAIVVAQMVNLFACRHPRAAAMQFSLKQNPLLLLGLGVELGLILFIVYTPWGNGIFATQAFEPIVWVLILALGFGGLEAGRKYQVRRGFRGGF